MEQKFQGMIKHFLFDVGNVLVFIDSKQLTDDLSKCFSTTPKKMLEVLEKANIRTLLESGKMCEETMCKLLNNAFATQVSLHTLKKTMCGCFSLNEKIIPLIHHLKAQNYALHLLSNTSKVHFEYLSTQYPFLNDFEQKILSFEQKIMKPEEKIYKNALEQCNAIPEEVFYADDIEDFCLAAKNLNIHAHHFKSVKGLEKHLTTLNILPK
jgi:putative hydrolase of the HAD superfamily